MFWLRSATLCTNCQVWSSLSCPKSDNADNVSHDKPFNNEGHFNVDHLGDIPYDIWALGQLKMDDTVSCNAGIAGGTHDCNQVITHPFKRHHPELNIFRPQLLKHALKCPPPPTLIGLFSRNLLESFNVVVSEN